MKIGFSFGRCIRDIVNGDVSYDDVAWIIGSTAIRDEEKVKMVIEDYLYRDDYLLGLDPETCYEVGRKLYVENKLIQPRLQGVHRHMVPEGAIWADMFPTQLSEHESTKNAWNAYRFMIHMTDSVPEDVQDNWK